MNSSPLVSVNILSFNRREELHLSLRKIYAQNYKNIEVIVVDNNSSDGSVEMVRTGFPQVKLLELNENVGISGWNRGFEAAKGEYILVLDDDSYPDADTIEKGLHAFSKREGLGIAAFNIFNLRLSKSETDGFKEVNPYLFVGCGALIKQEVIRKIGGFNELYFIYNHELDYSARCYNSGFSISYLPDIKVYHIQTLKSRGKKSEDPFKSEYRYYHYFLTHAYFCMQNFNLIFSIIFTLKWLANRAIIAVTFSMYGAFIKALFSLMKKTPKILRGRNPLKKEWQKFYHWGNLPLIDRYFFPNYRKAK